MRRFIALVALVAPIALIACSSTHKQPTGPAPEYEDPAAPSWLKDGGGPVTAAPSPLDQILAPTAPTTPPDGGAP